MKEVYILHNQDLLYLSKQGSWVPSTETQPIWHTPHKDVALNSRVEQSIKNPELRISITSATLNIKGHAVTEIATPLDIIDALAKRAQEEAQESTQSETTHSDLFDEQKPDIIQSSQKQIETQTETQEPKSLEDA